MGSKQDSNLTLTSLENARILRGELPEQVILHAKRGTQFTSTQLNKMAVAAGVRMPMCRTGVCWDNAMTEAFWATLKVEYFYRYAFATGAQVYGGVGGWIEASYNRYRRHSSIGYSKPRGIWINTRLTTSGTQSRLTSRPRFSSKSSPQRMVRLNIRWPAVNLGVHLKNLCTNWKKLHYSLLSYFLWPSKAASP